MLGCSFISDLIKFPREKTSSTHTWGQIGTTQLFNILLDILLAGQCVPTAADLTDHLPSCMSRVQKERAGEQESIKRIKGTWDHHIWRKTGLLKYQQCCKEILKFFQQLIRHDQLRSEEPQVSFYTFTSISLPEDALLQPSWKMQIYVKSLMTVVLQPHCTDRIWFSLTHSS